MSGCIGPPFPKKREKDGAPALIRIPTNRRSPRLGRRMFSPVSLRMTKLKRYCATPGLKPGLWGGLVHRPKAGASTEYPHVCQQQANVGHPTGGDGSGVSPTLPTTGEDGEPGKCRPPNDCNRCGRRRQWHVSHPPKDGKGWGTRISSAWYAPPGLVTTCFPFHRWRVVHCIFWSKWLSFTEAR